VLSRRLSALEARLGVRLVERSTRQLRFTDAGLRLVERLQQARQLLEEAEQEARQTAQECAAGCVWRCRRPWAGACSAP
jgi:DNA-binding transcriptional LysR family regulator